MMLRRSAESCRRTTPPSGVSFIRCPGRKPPFSMVKRGLIMFCDSKQWAKQAAAQGAGDRRFRRLSALRAPYKHAEPYRIEYAVGNAKARVTAPPSPSPGRAGPDILTLRTHF